MIHYSTCPICHSTGITKVFSVRDHSVTGEDFEVWQCPSCSLRFTQNVPEQGAIGRYYQSQEYISHTESSKGLINSIYLQVRRWTLRSKRKLVCRVTGNRKGGALLDVGAGTGAFVNHMQVHGWDVDGVEPDSDTIRRAATKYGVRLKPLSELFGLREKHYDAITLWHVLEHVHELHAYIDQLKKLCRFGGKLIIAVPNYTSVDAEHYGPNWAAYDVPRHLYHFSPLAMSTLMDLHGCTIEQIKPMWFDSFYVSMLSEKYKTGKMGLINGIRYGLKSNSRAFSVPRRASSLIYIISPHKK